MASPPYNHSYTSAISPPYPSHTSLPQPPKRRQSDMPSSAPAIKRRKASMLSTTSATSSAHPLRQTSFPPEMNSRASAISRSPSIDTVSLASGTGGKKKKAKKAKAKDLEVASIAGRKAKSTASGDGNVSRKRDATADPEEPADEEEAGGEEMSLNLNAVSKEEKAAEEKKKHMLIKQFDLNQDHFTRYEAWRKSKLADSVVRRIVNQTLSQSVPANVVLAIRSAAKIFAGELVEEARKVQTEWVEASNESQRNGEPFRNEKEAEEDRQRRGPLMADHLREAHRRRLIEADGGLVGELGLWQNQNHSGVERFAVKLGGKRLFK